MISAITDIVQPCERKFSVGIDFGCTLTGYGIRKNGDMLGSDIQKEPTAILYKITSKSVPLPLCWGKQAQEVGLKLDPQNTNFLYIDSVQDLLNDETLRSYLPTYLDTCQVVADFVTFIVQGVKSKGRKFYQKDFSLDYVQWIVSIPSKWSHQTKGIFRTGCFEAGMISEPSSEKLVLCPEPELVLIDYCCLQPRDEFRKGDLFATIDLGGREMKFNSFKMYGGMKYLWHDTELKLSVGSSQIDSAILCKFKKQVGVDNYLYWCDAVPDFQSTLKSKISLIKSRYDGIAWTEAIKIRVRSQQQETYDVDFVQLDEVKVVLEQYFTSVVESIDFYFSRLFNPSTGRVYLTVIGGICKSAALLERIRGCLVKYNVIVNEQEPSMAIIRGATELGLDQRKIRNRIYRYSYGTQFSKLFDPETDDPTAHKWGLPPHQYIASYLPFTTAGNPIPEDKVFEQMVCPANNSQTEFPFGLYYSIDQSSDMSNCSELTTIIVAIPPAYRNLGKDNRFKVLMNFRLTEIKFTVIHMQSGQKHETLIYF